MKKISKTPNKKHITIDTPCSVADMERFCRIVSHEGHWHDAMIFGKEGSIVIEFTVD